MASKLFPPSTGVWHKGCVMSAQRAGQAWMQPMIFDGTTFRQSVAPQLVSVSGIVDPAQARFCEPVEKSNSSHSFTAGLADTLGLRFPLTPLTFTNSSLVVLPLYLQLLLLIWI